MRWLWASTSFYLTYYFPHMAKISNNMMLSHSIQQFQPSMSVSGVSRIPKVERETWEKHKIKTIKNLFLLENKIN